MVGSAYIPLSKLHVPVHCTEKFIATAAHNSKLLLIWPPMQKGSNLMGLMVKVKDMWQLQKWVELLVTTSKFDPIERTKLLSTNSELYTLTYERSALRASLQGDYINKSVGFPKLRKSDCC